MLELDSNDSEVTRWVVGGGGERSELMEKDFKWRAFNPRYTQYGVTPYSRTVTGRTQKAVNVSTQTKRHTTAPLHKNRVINQPRSIEEPSEYLQCMYVHTFYIEYKGFN